MACCSLREVGKQMSQLKRQRETVEEAGVRGKVQSKLGEWDFRSKRYNKIYEGIMFPLLVKEQLELWLEKNRRQRKWMTVSQAREACRHWWMKEALDRLVQRLMQQQPEEEEDIISSLSEESEEEISACSLSEEEIATCSL